MLVQPILKSKIQLLTIVLDEKSHNVESSSISVSVLVKPFKEKYQSKLKKNTTNSSLSHEGLIEVNCETNTKTTHLLAIIKVRPTKDEIVH